MKHPRSEQVGSSFEVAGLLSRHPDTTVLQAREARAYVSEMFPQFSEAIFKATIVKNENTAFCSKIGCPPGVGGCYFVAENLILLCWNRKFDDDELVACHELLHLASRLCGSMSTSVVQEENFAFSKSIAFALSRGKSEEWVRTEYMWPFYYSLCMATALTPQEKKLAEKKAKEMINTLFKKEIGVTTLWAEDDEEQDDSPLSYL